MNLQHPSRPLNGGVWLASLTVLGLLHGCGGSDADEASRSQYIQSAFVMIGTKSEAIARVITNYAPPAGSGAQAACPLITVDGGVTRMNLRAAPLSLRPNAAERWALP